MPLQVLVAENDPATMQTTVEALEDTFQVIPAKNLDEAKNALNSHPVLAAILMDGRLDDDSDQKDRSGWDLADELQSTGLARAPIIMYSQFEQTREHAASPENTGSVSHVPRITYLPKEVESDELVKTILKEIHLNLKTLPNLEEIPRYHQPPILAYAPNNGIGPIAEELRKRGEPTEVLDKLDELKTAMNLHPSAIFAVDVSDQAGLDAINVLHSERSNSDQNFYIAALTSGNEISPDVLRAGVNAFVSKDSPQAVASEIMLRKAEFKIEIERKQLALGQYRKLVVQLTDAKNSASHDISPALRIVERALDWPFLMSNENVVLTSLYFRLFSVPEAGMDPETFDLCIEGASMLAQDRAAGGDVRNWIERARRHSANFTLTLLDDDAFSGDAEETDD
jgi:CheY-like chemotaxis protein